MNRIKKEFKRRGFKLECDYDHMLHGMLKWKEWDNFNKQFKGGLRS